MDYGEDSVIDVGKIMQDGSTVLAGTIDGETVFIRKYSSLVNSTSSKHTLGDDWYISPNPSQELITISGANKEDLIGRVQLFDQSGRLVSTVTLSGVANSIKVNRLLSGQYMLRYTSDEGAVWTSSFLKQ